MTVGTYRRPAPIATDAKNESIKRNMDTVIPTVCAASCSQSCTVKKLSSYISAGVVSECRLVHSLPLTAL